MKTVGTMVGGAVVGLLVLSTVRLLSEKSAAVKKVTSALRLA